MSVALFDAPPRITFSQPSMVGGSRAGLLLGVQADGNVLNGICCLEDGSVSLVHASWFSVDFRYDVETDRFLDQNAQKGDQEG